MRTHHAVDADLRGHLRLQTIGAGAVGHGPDPHPVQRALVGAHLFDERTEAGRTHPVAQRIRIARIGERAQLHGDRVVFRQVGQDRRGRPEAAIIEVLERVNETVVARLYCERGVWFAVPEDRRLNQDILIEPAGTSDAEHGQVVMVAMVEQPSRHKQPMGRVVEVLGNYADSGMEIEIALRKHDLPHTFSEDAMAQARATPKKVRKKDLTADRRDLRDLPLVTIDGETARDFDDAVYCEPQGKGFRLVVAIADVSHYVEHGDALDHTGRQRGNSVYFPRRVIP